MNTRFHLPLVWVAAVLVLLLAAGCANRASKDDIRAALREDPDLVLDVLREHPAELDQVLTATARAREERIREARRQEELKNPLKPDLFGNRVSLGAEDAPVVMVCYSDFLCGYCAAAAKTVHALLSGHPGQVRFIYKHFPHSRPAAELALYFEALGRQDPALAWRFHDEAFAHQKELSKGGDALEKILADLAPDRERLERDLRDPVLLQRLSDDTREADRFGFDGTPSFVIGGVSLVGSLPLARFEEVLDLVLRNRAGGAAKDRATAGEAPCADCPQK